VVALVVSKLLSSKVGRAGSWEVTMLAGMLEGFGTCAGVFNFKHFIFFLKLAAASILLFQT